MGNKLKVTEGEFIDIGSRMAQELQEFIDEAERAGGDNPLPGTKALIEEWEAIYARSDTWMEDIASSSTENNNIAALSEE